MKKFSKIYILIYFVLLLISCKNQTNHERKEQNKNINEFYFYLSPHIEIWNHTGKDYIIGEWGEKHDTYERSIGWNNNDYPYPKNFDFKLLIDNNPLMYENPTKIGKWELSVYMKFKVGLIENGTYLLNAKIADSCNIIKDMIISDENFSQSSRLEIWKYQIEFEKFYNKFKNQNLNINQLIFEILLKRGDIKCKYEYIFPMYGEQEM